MPRFDMVGYTPHKSVTIYHFNSSNDTRCTPTRLSRLCSIPGTSFVSESFSSARMHSIFSSSLVSFLLLFGYPIFLHSYDPVLLVLLFLGVIIPFFIFSPGHETYTLRCIAAMYVFLTGVLLRHDKIQQFVSLSSIDTHCWQDG